MWTSTRSEAEIGARSAPKIRVFSKKIQRKTAREARWIFGYSWKIQSKNQRAKRAEDFSGYLAKIQNKNGARSGLKFLGVFRQNTKRKSAREARRHFSENVDNVQGKIANEILRKCFLGSQIPTFGNAKLLKISQVLGVRRARPLRRATGDRPGDRPPCPRRRHSTILPRCAAR